MGGNSEAELKGEKPYYVLLVFSMDEEVEDLDVIVERIFKGDREGIKLERIAAMKNSALIPS